ncbi:hypothetical protein SAMN04487951_1088 [Vreelandella arcis]|uniref:Uncharacterized protein n=2 Tax=Vreelandella arcis TaxID=416873 RepID=A0A1H0E3V1_9GAMM|nr:hypothetical protein SAMN04487951_1088 [Halomonas arcis]
MLSLKRSAVNVEIQSSDHEFTKMSATAIPATPQQIASLGNEVIGEAWGLSSHFQQGPKTIKFAPPETVDAEAQWQQQQCYRRVLTVADQKELVSLSLSMPGSADGLVASADALSYALAGVDEALPHLRHLRHLQLVVDDEIRAHDLFQSS